MVFDVVVSCESAGPQVMLHFHYITPLFSFSPVKTEKKSTIEVIFLLYLNKIAVSKIYPDLSTLPGNNILSFLELSFILVWLASVEVTELPLSLHAHNFWQLNNYFTSRETADWKYYAHLRLNREMRGIKMQLWCSMVKKRINSYFS